MQARSRPYIDRRYNRLEIFSYITGLLTVFAAYYFVVGQVALVNDPKYAVAQSEQLAVYKIILIVFVILFQCVFFCLVAYQFHIETRKYIMNKYPEFYQKFYNCNDLKK